MNASLKAEWLAKIDQVVETGFYKADWASLAEHPVPRWYQDAKFGIFIHWGAYSVPAFGNEWYPRNMYLQGTSEYEHHLKTYGPHKDFGYADFIPLFKGERFSADDWAALFEAAGARYVVPVAEHHDGFQMYDSALSDWNAAKMGPKRNVLGELKAAFEARGLTFAASSHRAENYFFFSGGRDFDSGIRDIEVQEPYGWACREKSNALENGNADTEDLHAMPACQAHLEDWLIRCCELVDRYRPRIVYFDWWIQNLSFKPYLKKFAAFYYNRALEWGVEVAINSKHEAYPCGTSVFDVERGQLASIRTPFWQTDTAIAKNSWGYTDGNDFKHAEDIVCDLVDIVSKNGTLLLNVGPKSDGTITDEERAVLTSIGGWLKTNGEAIYGTKSWKVFGEGPTEIPEGQFTDTDRKAFTPEDLRFTWSAPNLYVTALARPANGRIVVRTLKKGAHLFQGEITSVTVLGHDGPVTAERTADGLVVVAEGLAQTGYPVVVKIATE